MRALQSVVIATAIVVTLTQPAAALTSSLPTGTQDPAFTGKPSGTLPPPTPETLPKAPILSARWKTADTVMLDYIDTSLVETGFRLEQRPAGGAWQAVMSLGPRAGKFGQGEFRLTGFTERTDYCFRLMAFNAAGASSGEVCVRTTYAKACDEVKLTEVLGPAVIIKNGDKEDDFRAVEIGCDLYLEPQNVVFKRLVFVGSRARNLTVDLNGATLSGLDGTPNEGRDMIEVRSEEAIRRDDESGISGYYRPSNITIRNGRVYGSIRLWGMAKNGEGDADKQTVCSKNVCLEREIPGSNQLKKSSRLPDHTARVQNNAPTGIVLQNLEIYGTGRNPVYFGPGVTNSKLLDSQVLGRSNQVGIYLDAESAGNTIKGNRIDVATGDGFWTEPRPLIAIDGSARNRIINNWFSSLNHGGINFYRNCGEGGVIRHQAPSANQVINNIFFYDQYDGDNPAVFLGSRDRQSWYEEGGPVTFCDDDDGYPYGSSFQNEDVAIYNAIMQNQIFKRPVADVVRVQNLPVNSPNFNVSNTTVTESTVQVGRIAGCYNGGGNAGLIAHGTIVATTGTGCRGTESVCQDGEIISRPFSRCGEVAPAATVPVIRR